MRVASLALLVLSACAVRQGAVDYTTLQSAAEQRPMTYATYTPPGWDGETPLPLVVFLHGGGDDHTVLDKHGVVVRRLDAWIEEGTLPPFVMVAPNGEKGFWRNWHDGSHNFEDWVLDEVIPDAYARYNLLPEPEGMHLMGISMGGAGTLYMGLDNLDRFASMTVFSAPIFTPEQTLEFLDGGFVARFAPFDRIFGPADPERLREDNAYVQVQSEDDMHGTQLIIGAGTVDIGRILRSTRDYSQHLDEHAVPHDLIVYKGGHRWVDWSRVFPVALCRHLEGEACTLPDSSFYTLTERGGGGVAAAE